ncbi:MAG: AAA family ATPase [Phaeodactylibacter sp.]|nr:AAA family ATPase [Phaeodactylibacter sp.]
MPDRTPPFLIIVTGLPGTGKTTFARALAERIGAHHLNTDIIRDELGLRGQYDKASKQKVYQKMRNKTSEALKAGRTVIVDGTFFRKALREPYEELGVKFNAPVYRLVIEAPEETIRKRTAQKREYSEADFEVYLKVRDEWEPLEKPHLSLVSADLEGMVEKAFLYLQTQNKAL